MAHPLPIVSRAQSHAQSLALVDDLRRATYAQLLAESAAVATTLLDSHEDLEERRVALLVPPGVDYATSLWGIWRAGGVALPLGVMHPPREWEYALDDAAVSAIVVAPEYLEASAPIAQSRSLPLLLTDTMRTSASSGVNAPTGEKMLPFVAEDRRALMLYTSGTTGQPKGVVHTHASLAAQIECLAEAWAWNPADHILHVLPLHHIHGIVNVLLCPLWVGATCEFLPKFEATLAWSRIAQGDATLFMAVPTIYAKLAAAWHRASPSQRRAYSNGCRKIRLMVSGSAALPVTTWEEWRKISGHELLERYGMTEIGMALSNPLNGRRLPGYVGQPLPNVAVRLVDREGQVLSEDVAGEIEVSGPTVFKEYWNRPDATRDAFRDGWFRTGDVAIVEKGAFRILGRASVDIIKTGGYKVSALEIEEVLRTHDSIRDCAVVGLDDQEWGQVVAVALVLQDERELTLHQLRAWTKEQLAPYKVPTRMQIMAELPKNALGKVQKPRVVDLFTHLEADSE